MEPLLMVLVPGVLGGIVLAFLIPRIRVHGLPQRERPLDPPNPGLISDADYEAGMHHLRAERPVLRSDVRLYATTAWLGDGD